MMPFVLSHIYVIFELIGAALFYPANQALIKHCLTGLMA